jgi:AbrB family looped-hinge helix DNA binding protein
VDVKGSGRGFGPVLQGVPSSTAAILKNGRFDAMRTTIDPAGRLVIPKRIRDRLGLRGNEQVEITERDGRIEIEPAPTDVELVREGSILVARPDRSLPPLTDEIVRETLDRVRR